MLELAARVLELPARSVSRAKSGVRNGDLWRFPQPAITVSGDSVRRAGQLFRVCEPAMLARDEGHDGERLDADERDGRLTEHCPPRVLRRAFEVAAPVQGGRE